MSALPGAWGRALGLVALACAVAGCDGFDPQVVRTGGTGSIKSTVASGPISGLGSLVVNGVRFDESGARVTVNGVPDRPVTDLQLGMVVRVRGDVDTAARVGKADAIEATAVLSGAATGIDVAKGEATVLSQRVEVKPGTVLQGASSLADVRNGASLVVYGFWDYSAGHVDATRVEVRPQATAPPTAIVGRLSEVAGTRWKIGGLAIEVSGASVANLPGGASPGLYVEARGTLDPGGVLRASAVEGRAEFDPVEGARTELEGYVSEFAGLASFRVLGVAVNGAGARMSGAAASLANGALVEIEGQFAQGTLVATAIEVKAGPRQVPPPAATTLSGVISDFVSASSFRVRDQAVDASAATFAGGNAADLANGREVVVTGLVDGSVLRAGSVSFTAPMVPEGSRFAVSGEIESFLSTASFLVNGQRVAATAATAFAGGTAADLANGRRVSVDGTLAAGLLTAATITFQAVQPASAVSLAGAITDFASATSFKVNNQPITTTAATLYDVGSVTSLANGRLVQIDGTLSAGVVVAAKVHFSDSTASATQAEVEGTIMDFVSVSRFTVKGQLVDASAATFSNGKASDLANGLQVHVKGPVVEGVLRAATVEIDR